MNPIKCEEYKKLLEQETEPTPEQMDIMSEHAHGCAHCQAIALELETRMLTSDFETPGEGEAFFNNFFSDYSQISFAPSVTEVIARPSKLSYIENLKDIIISLDLLPNLEDYSSRRAEPIYLNEGTAKLDFKSIKNLIISTLIMGTVITIYRYIIPINSIFTTLLPIFIGFLIYITCIYILDENITLDCKKMIIKNN